MQKIGYGTHQLHESTPLMVAEKPECEPQLQLTQSLLCCGPLRRATKHEWQGIESRILKAK
jgi:hypothetical protein